MPTLYVDLYTPWLRHLFNYIYINLQSAAYIKHTFLTAWCIYLLMNCPWQITTKDCKKYCLLLFEKIRGDNKLHQRELRKRNFQIRRVIITNWAVAIQIGIDTWTHLIIKYENKTAIIVILQLILHPESVCVLFSLLIFKFSLYIFVWELFNTCWFNGDKATSNMGLFLCYGIHMQGFPFYLLVPSPFRFFSFRIGYKTVVGSARERSGTLIVCMVPLMSSGN